jgi:PRTRC genetic system protein C
MRVFKIGETIIHDNPSTEALNTDQVKDALKRAYPEVIHAAVSVTEQENGLQVVEFKPQAGRKG